MAKIDFSELVKLLADSQSPRHEGGDDPREVLQLSFGRGPDDDDSRILDRSMAGQTLAYEAPQVTIVLDFDDRGYVKAIEFV